MQVTPTEQKILDILQSEACISAKAISLELGWSIDDGGRNVRKYLKRLQDKGAIRVVPQRIEVVPLSGKDNNS